MHFCDILTNNISDKNMDEIKYRAEFGPKSCIAFDPRIVCRYKIA